MFTLLFSRKLGTPKAYHFHAANTASSVLNNPNTLNPQFHQDIVPEDQILMDAASRVIQQMHTIPDATLAQAFQQLQGLTIGADFVAPAAGAPAAGAPGCLADIQARITPLNASLSGLQALYDELVGAGWTGSALEQFGQMLTAMHMNLPGMQDIQRSYQEIEISLNQYHRVSDMHGTLKVLTPGEVETLNKELLAVNGTPIEVFFATLTSLDESILERRLAEIKAKPEYRTLITNKASFDKRFLSYFSQVLLENSNTKLDATKERIFGDRRGEFEGLVNRSRRAVMEDILSLDIANPDHLERLHQIFLTDRRYFQRTGNTHMVNPVNRIAHEQYAGQMVIVNAINTTPAGASLVDVQDAVAAALITVAHPPAMVAAAQGMALVAMTASTHAGADRGSVLAAAQAALMPAVPAPLPAVALDWDNGMRDRVVAVLQRYYPQMIARYIRPATVSRIPGMSTPARTAEGLADAILDQNTGESLMYYTDANPIRATENNSIGQSASRFLGFAGEKMNSFFKASKPWVQSFMGAAKKITETVAGTVGNVAKVSADFVGKKVISGTTGVIDKKTASVDAWAWKKREKGFWNTVGWMAKMPARPVTKLAKLLTWSTDGLIGKGLGENVVAKGVDKILVGGTKLTYNTLNEAVAKIPDNDVNDMFSGAGWLLHKSGEWTGRLTDMGGNWLYGSLKTAQKREILSGLRTGLDELGQAGFQSAMFRSTMRNWGVGANPVAPTPPVAPAAAVAPTPPVALSDGQIVVLLNAIRTAGHATTSLVLDALAAEAGAHPETPKFLTAYRAAYTESNRRGTRGHPAPTPTSVIQAALGAL